MKSLHSLKTLPKYSPLIPSGNLLMDATKGAIRFGEILKDYTGFKRKINMENNFNLIIGEDAGKNLIGGDHNIYLGKGAGENITEESYTFRLAGTYEKKMTHKQWEKLHAALRWIVMGDDSGIEPDKTVMGNDSTRIGIHGGNTNLASDIKLNIDDKQIKP